MKTNPVSTTNIYREPVETKKHQSFKGVGDGIVALMNGIDRGGLAASFTIQDCCGTNIPRTWTGLHRNKDITGKYNYQEASEVALREFITGPSMFAIPMTILYFTKKFIGKALDVPVAHIDAFSDILNKNPDLMNSNNIKNPKNFKSEFYNKIFVNMLETSVDGMKKDEIDKVASDFTNELLKIESAKSKGIINNIRNKKVTGSREDLVSALVEKFSNLRKSSSVDATSDFFNAGVSGGKDKVATAKFVKTLNMMTNYSDDILSKAGKKLTNYDSKSVLDFVSSFSKTRIGGRFALNLGLFGSVIAFCTIIPRIYMRNKHFPGVNGLVENPEKQIANKTSNSQVKIDKKQVNKNNTPAFRGVFDGLGRKVSNSDVLRKVGKTFEFQGYDMPLASLVTVCYGGVLVPRLMFARDENEFKEIAIRDVTSMAVLLFGRKAVQNIVSKICSKASGVALAKLPQKSNNIFKNAFDYLRPEKGVKVYNNTELSSKYVNIDKFKNGIVDFCDFLNKSGGDVAKVFKADKQLAEVAEKAYKASNVGGDFKTASSEKIVEAFTKLHKEKSSSLNGVYDYFKNADNNIVKKAKVMNSTFDFLTIFGFIPLVLGYALPKLTEKDIKDKFKNANKVENQSLNNDKNINLKTEKGVQVFKNFR